MKISWKLRCATEKKTFGVASSFNHAIRAFSASSKQLQTKKYYSERQNEN